MSRWTPCKRRHFIKKLRALGLEGPYAGSRHEFMTYGHHRMAVPSNLEYSVPQLRMMLREVETILGRAVSATEWSSL